MYIKRYINIIVTTWLLVVNSNIYSQVTANFTVEDSTGCNSKIIHFMNQSTGSGTLSYFWDLGNGTTSTLENPIAAFTITGSYTVQLIVSNETESDTLTKENYINIYANPIANFKSSGNLMACAPLEVSFINNSLEGDAPIEYNIWDFGDNNFVDEVSPVHVYQETGIYTVTLTITDTNGCNNSFFIEDYITALDKPNINFSSDIQKTCNDSLRVLFSNLSDSDYELTYNWDFGNGGQSSDFEPEALFSGFGIYSIKLIGESENGCKDSIIKVDYIKLNYLMANIDIIENIVCKNQQITITNNTTGANIHNWDFGDGEILNSFEPIKFYLDTGKFYIQYIASFDNICSDTIIDSVYVDPVQANFITDENYICELPKTINYSDQSINANSWKWRFGNGEVSEIQNPEIVYDFTDEINAANRALYSDTLIVTSVNGCIDSLIVDSGIVIIIPKVYFTPNDSNTYTSFTSGCLPLGVDFLDKSLSLNPDDPFVSRSWDFGNGETSADQNPEYTYYETGEFEVSLSITNLSGCTNSYHSGIKVGTPQIADFDYEGEYEICGSEEVQFFDLSSIDTLVNDWLWIFGDGSQSKDRNAIHVFIDTGYMSTQLTVKYNACFGEESTIFKDSVVKIKAPAGEFGYSFDCEDPLNYIFNSNVYGADSIIWNFGDGFYDSTNMVQINHLYDISGDYSITNITKNISNGCELVLNLPLFARKLIPYFEYSPDFNCVADTITFDASLSKDVGGFFHEGNFGSFMWDFDQNLENDDTITLGNAYYKYNERGLYDISLIVKDINNCWDTLAITIKIYKPNAGFNLLNNIGCLPLTVNFNDLTLSDTTITSWNWDFGNGDSSTNQNTLYTFSDTGLYTISLITEDILACRDTLTKENIVFVSKPFPSFTVDNQIMCFGDILFIEDHSSGNDLNYLWDFGDGNTSNLTSPEHIYQDTGFYDISLYLIDSLLCDTNISFTNFIYVQANPVAGFAADYTNSVCYPALIRFNDLSVSDDLNYWQWDFGDGYILENNPDPMHNYFIPGMYDVKLLVKTLLGCTNSLTKYNYMNIGGPYADILAPDSACINEEVLLTFENQINVFDFEWIMNDGTSYFNDSIYIASSNFETINYNLSLKSDSISTCDKIISDSIVFPILIAAIQLNNSSGCVPFTLIGQGNSTGAIKWYWDFGNENYDSIPDINFEYNLPGEFLLKLIIENEIHCKDSVLKQISVYHLPVIEISNDTLICKNDSIRIFASGGESYSWYENEYIENITINNPLVYPEVDMYFSVIVTDSNSCVDYDSVFIQVQQIPFAVINNKDSVKIIVGEEVYLSAWDSLADNYYWYPEEFLSCIYCSGPIASPLESTVLFYEVRDENNCFIIKDSVFIYVEHKFSLDMPNAFTPNGDGLNDSIYIKGWGIKEIIEFKVFNQFGKKVYESDALNSSWDGTNNGEFLPVGTYYYTVTVLNYDNKTRSKQGYFHLLK